MKTRTITAYKARLDGTTTDWFGTCARWARPERFTGSVTITKVAVRVVGPMRTEECACTPGHPHKAPAIAVIGKEA